MLYINAYIVSRVWYSPAEGGCWFDAGQPIASIPIATEYKPGHTYYMSEGSPVIQDCPYCEGTGLVDNCEEPEEYTSYKVRCKDCGEIPKYPTLVPRIISRTKELLKDEPGRREELRFALEDHMAQAYPEQRPHYE